MKLGFFLWAFFSFSILAAQNGKPFAAGAKGAAMGDASVTFTDIYSATSNQAGLAFLKNFAAFVSAEQRFLLADLKAVSGAVAFPTKSGTFALNLQYFGFQAFNEQKIGLAYARKLTEKVAIGAQLDYLNTRIEEYGNKGAVTFELGLTAFITPQLIVASHLFSPLQVEVISGENLPTVFKIGAAYLPSDQVRIAVEMEKDIDFDARFKGGVEYQFLDRLFLRAGVGTNPTTYSFGMGLDLGKKLNVNVASNIHQVLGFSPSVDVAFSKD